VNRTVATPGEAGLMTTLVTVAMVVVVGGMIRRVARYSAISRSYTSFASGEPHLPSQ